MRTKDLSPIMLVLLIIGLLAIGLSACSGTAAAQVATQEGTTMNSVIRTITVNGSGKAHLAPDIAYINIGVHSEGENAAEVVDANSTQTQAVIEALRQAGIESKDLRTTNFSIWPQQKFDPAGQPSGEVSYMVDNTVYVTLRDLERLGEVLDQAVGAGANSINGIQFDVEDKSTALSEGRKAAVADAARIAQELASAAGVELGQIQHISTVNAMPLPMYGGMGGGARMDMAQSAAVPVSPGEMLLTVDVAVTYEIR